MKIPAPAVALLASIGLAWPASAAPLGPMFTVVDLGPGYHLQADPTGTVTGAAGGPAYAFDKSPTTSINTRYESSGLLTPLPQLGQWHYQSVHGGGYIQGTLQNGSLVQGYFSEMISGSSPVAIPHVPLGFYINGDWHNELVSPVSDMNANGAFVGTSFISNRSYGPTYAAFSTATGNTHELAHSSVADNLNNYIDSSLGINLTAGLKIDDLGRIIAAGTVDGQGHDFLLIPAGLPSDPIPTPEPSTLALLAVASAGWIARRRFRR